MTDTHFCRAYLDEPQGEPEYVWRAWCAAIGDNPQEFFAEADARLHAENWREAGEFCPVERAQIGPWEVCDG